MSSLREVEALANRLLDKEFTVPNGIGTRTLSARSIGYKFKFDNAKVRMGLCSYTRKTISLSKPLVLNNLDKIDGKITDTILHEIAHTLSREIFGKLDGSGHGHNWVNTAKAIGCNGRRCYSSSELDKVQSKWTLHCPTGCTISRHKRTRIGSKSSCPYCSGGYFNEKFLLVWKQNH